MPPRSAMFSLTVCLPFTCTPGKELIGVVLILEIHGRSFKVRLSAESTSCGHGPWNRTRSLLRRRCG